MRESEERLTSVSGVVLLLDHFEFITLGLQSFQGFVRSKTGLHRTVFDEGFSEVINLDNQVLNVVDKALLEFGFLNVHLTSDLIGLVHKLVPAFVKGFLVIAFILVHNVREVDF
jgi:hypothetical protein